MRMMTTTELFPATRAVMYRPGYRAILLMDGMEVWCCEHVHRTSASAQLCADEAFDRWPSAIAS